MHTTFKQYLETEGSRYTTQKKSIVNAIAKTKHHFEVEEFIASLHKKDKNFSRSTIYRTIKQLLDAKLLQKISTQDGKVYYEQTFDKKRHAHLICNVCGSIEEISEDTLAVWVNNYCKLKNFKPEYQSIHIYGKCSKH